ncbi:MAG: hypothetical protein WCO98_10835 [bacterium]
MYNISKIKIAGKPLSDRLFCGIGVEADCCIYDELNRNCGVNDDDYARLERRMKAMRPGIARIFLSLNDFNPSGDECTYDWDSENMRMQIRNLRVLRDAGAMVNVCMSPWTNKEMMEPGKEKLAVDLIDYLVNRIGFDNIHWLSLFNEPDGMFAPDTDFERSMVSDGKITALPWTEYVDKHLKVIELLKNCNLDKQVKLVVVDSVWPYQRRVERLTLAAADFKGCDVGYSFHHYVPEDTDFFNHPESAKWKPPVLNEEIAGYRDIVGPDAELICWETNNVGYGMSAVSPGSTRLGEDVHGTMENAVSIARKVLIMLANGVDGVCQWCVGDMFYGGNLKLGLMNFGLWRYKWENWMPRPVYFYYSALMQTFRPGSLLYPLTGLPENIFGMAVNNKDEWKIVLLNANDATANISLEVNKAISALRVSSNTIPSRADCAMRENPNDDMPISNWDEKVNAENIALSAGELIILKFD